MIGSGKHSSLLQYGNNYCHKKFYSTGPRTTFCQSFIFFLLQKFGQIVASEQPMILEEQKAIFWNHQFFATFQINWSNLFLKDDGRKAPILKGTIFLFHQTYIIFVNKAKQ